MLRFLLVLSATLALTFCGEASREGVTPLDDDESEMGERSRQEVSKVLYVPPRNVTKERAKFLEALKKSGRTTRGKRELYEKHIDVIGANGILDVMQELWPKCHSEAHALGAEIQERVQDITVGLQVCRDGCYSGCMHGILMEAFSAARDPNDPEGHVNTDLARPMMNDLCAKNAVMTASYSPGDCAHGVGHALMFLVEYDIPEALSLCEEFDLPAMDYYCATGAYMQYMGEREKQDAKERSILYPCDTYAYPAACARYKMVHVLRRHLREKRLITELVSECEKLTGKFRLGCFHGLGNGAMGRIRSGKLHISDVCLSGSPEDQFVCIEGAMERMAKYHRERAQKVCAELEGKNRKTCLAAVERGMYDLEKDLTLYLLD